MQQKKNFDFVSSALSDCGKVLTQVWPAHYCSEYEISVSLRSGEVDIILLRIKFL